MNKIKYLIVIVLLLIASGCTSKKYENPIVTMEIEEYGTIEIELYPEYAPNTVANFVNLIESGFYDGNNFHRLAKDFVLQGGDPNGNGTGGPGYSIKGEFSKNGYTKNTLSHDVGIISMARSHDMDSAGSQFFIVLSASAKYALDDKYAGFGKVTKGMEILKEIESSEEVIDDISGKLKENITITKVTVDTKGATYKVEKIKK
jgi:peptidyl-prolyl cis-trans isomerase B (cyclophilin B)